VEAEEASPEEAEAAFREEEQFAEDSEAVEAKDFTKEAVDLQTKW